MLWRRLQAVGLLDPDKSSYGRLFGKLRKALTAAQVPADFRRIALDVLSTADAGHNTRNAFAHTIFMNPPPSSATTCCDPPAMGSNPGNSRSSMTQRATA